MAKAKTAAKAASSKGGRTYKLIELVGTSTRSYEDAIQQAVKDAAVTIRGLAWYEVQELRGLIQDSRVTEYQAKLRVGFRVLGLER